MRRVIHILLLLGGLNSGFIGLMGHSPIDLFFDGGGVARLFYLLVGLAAGLHLLLRKRVPRRLNIGPIGSSNL